MPQTSRTALAAELMRGVPAESRADHQTIADALIRGDEVETILGMPEVDRWPETYRWLKTVLREA